MCIVYAGLVTVRATFGLVYFEAASPSCGISRGTRVIDYVCTSPVRGIGKEELKRAMSERHHVAAVCEEI